MNEQSVEITRSVLTRYLESDHANADMMADDVVFTIMATGEEHRGREAVLALLEYFYRQAFTASAEPHVTLFDAAHATFEGTFAGRHTGEFMGVPATGRDVRVPLCVVYDVDGGQITAGRVYFEVPALLAQLGESPG